MIDWADKHLVPEWRAFWKRWSVQFAALVASSISTILAQPNLLFTVLNYLPADPVQRGVAAAVIGLFMWFAPLILVLLKQKNLEKTDGN
jgi:hypothetical protein